MQTLIQDLRFGARMLLRKPGFTLIAVITLGLGIGANTTIFSVVNAVLLRPLPYQNPEQLVMIWGKLPAYVSGNIGASAAEFADYRDQNPAFSSIAAYTSSSFNLTGAGEPERIVGTVASASLFPLLNVRPALGRSFLNEEDRPGHDRVVILSHSLWRRRFAGAASVIGQSVTLDGQSHTIIGVAPAGFQFPDDETELWKPIAFSAEQLSENERGSRYLSVIARMKPGVTIGRAQADIAALAQRMQREHPVNYETDSGWGVTVVSLREETVGDVRLALQALFGAVGCVLLIGCANVANLLLARASTRRREMAIRAALGGRPGRIIRQLLTESLLLSLAGGGLGALIAVWGVGLIAKLSASTLPRVNEVSIDGRAIGFTFVLTVVTGLLFGLAPAWQSARTDLNESLKESGGKGVESGGRHRLRGLLVVGEIALALMLLVGAGLMVKSLYRLQQVEPGFDPAHALTMRLALPDAKYPEPQRQRDFYERLLDRIAALPGVKAAGAINFLPLSGTGNQRSFLIEGKPEPKLNVGFRMVSPDYFRAMGVPLRAGRLIDERDRENAPRVAVVNETFASIFLANEYPLGKRIKLGSAQGPFPWLTIAGVVGDVKHGGLDRETRPEMYVPYLQGLLPSWGVPPMFLVVRSESEPAGLTAAVRGVVKELDRDQPVYDVATMERLLSKSTAPRRFNMTLLAVFAALALTLAGVGIYGVMAYAVTERTREIGIRMALGAQASDALKLVIRQGMRLTLVGVALGSMGAFALTGLIKNLLFNVRPTDPLTFIVIALLLTSVALLACWIPARRATKVDPMIALRCE
ncbi:MAG TPA: ABC transporter permease [Blastocatellia bacterium]|jgi:putative ABC transport system permease protein|nr:ABC transporter permease [Blastocatellia bacterium]